MRDDVVILLCYLTMLPISLNARISTTPHPTVEITWEPKV